VAEAINPNGSLTEIGAYSGGQISMNGEPNSVIAYPTPACPSVTAP